MKETESASKNSESTRAMRTETMVNAPEKITGLSQVYKRLNKRASNFVIRTDRDTVIKCKEGTLLSIPAGAFLNGSTQKQVAGKVKISVKEFYKLSDMMIAGLTTTSNDQLLETGGMINIKVTGKENNDSCVLKPGKNITIALVNRDSANVDRMQLFNGVHDSATINWVPRSGVAGLSQNWRFGRNFFFASNDFVFPEGIPKIKPLLKNSNPGDLQVEIKLSVRDLGQHVGLVTKRANAYVDTTGSLNCYKIAGIPQLISFNELYSVTTVQNIKVNVAVDVSLSYRSHLNHDYFQKLFKMGKGNPDSLVTVTATLNPAVKMTSFDKVKTVYNYAVTVKEYQKKQNYLKFLLQEYESRIEKLRLKDEENLLKSENNASTNLQSAQNYLMLSTSKLGWINCDRFYKSPTKVDYFVKLKEQASVLIVFKSLRSIMSSDMDGSFKGVPLNEKITIVGLKTENGKLMMALHETTVTREPFEALSFKPVTIKEYKNRLEKLNRL